MRHKKRFILLFIILPSFLILNTVYSDTEPTLKNSCVIMSFPIPAMTSNPIGQTSSAGSAGQTNPAGQSRETIFSPVPATHSNFVYHVGDSVPVDQSTLMEKANYVWNSTLIAQSTSLKGQQIPAGQTTSIDQSIPVGQLPSAGKNIPVGQSAPDDQSIPVGQSKVDSIPIGQSENQAATEGSIPAEDLFGSRAGRFHPFLLLQGIYTDNLFDTDSNTKDDFITTAAPGIWLAFPANREKLLTIDTTTTSPGGLQLSRIKPEATRRYQTYLMYSPEFVHYFSYSRHDHVDHKAEGLFQYNFDSGISFDVIDLFNHKEEIAGNGVIDTLYRHQDNLFDFITTYETPSGKLKLKFDYSNYDLNYRETIVSYRDRNDNSFGLSLFYKFWPKTSLFGEYNYSKIDFDHGTTDDSVENRYYGGVNWDITAKTRGRLKLGYITKDFDSEGVKDQDGFSIELQAQHNLTSKLGLQANAYRKFNESDMANASSFLSTGIDLSLIERFSAKWSGTLDASYERDEYNGVDRNDDLYSFGPAVRFKPKRYLFFDLGAHYYYNNSDINIFDYKAYEIFLRITLSM